MTLMPARICILLTSTIVLAAHAADLNRPVLVPRPLPAPASNNAFVRKATPAPLNPSSGAAATHASTTIAEQAVILQIRRAPSTSKPKASSVSAASAISPSLHSPLLKDGELRIKRSGLQMTLPGAQ